MTFLLETSRLYLRTWLNEDRDNFAALHADPEVMRDLGGPIARKDADAKLERYVAAFNETGLSRWAMETRAGEFLGYAGIMPRAEHPLGQHFEIGWRLARDSWGLGYATEAAQAALEDAFKRGQLAEVLSYTSRDNMRSQAVMDRLGMVRDASRDFTAMYSDIGAWRGLVWVATPPVCYSALHV